MKMLVDLPEKLTPGMKIKSGKGALATVIVPHLKTRRGAQLYRLRYQFKTHSFVGSQLFTHEELLNSGCRQRLTREEAIQYALTH